LAPLCGRAGSGVYADGSVTVCGQGGRKMADEYFYDSAGRFCGKIDSDGYIYDREYRVVGKKDFDGYIYDNGGKRDGKDPKSFLKCKD
jgi:hypothetical protein